jgi:SAM-dependent methyltransferase
MRFPEISGLIFPDAYVQRFFFKTGCNRRTGSVLELGCGNGNNLMLFYHYGWNVVGVDQSQAALEDARSNFKAEDMHDATYRFIHRDLAMGLGEVAQEKFDVIVVANMLYYLLPDVARSLMKELKSRVTDGALVFLRNRSLKDFRYGRGQPVVRNTFRLALEETGEKGLINAFYSEYELVDMLRESLDVDCETLQVLSVEYQNLQQGVVVSNSDIVIWGRVRG